MSLVLQRIEQTRDALVDALAERNWEAIGQLDLACRSCMEDVLSESEVDEAALRNNLEELLGCIGSCWRRRRGASGDRRRDAADPSSTERRKGLPSVRLMLS